MRQKIEIEVPEGKKAIWKDGKIIFEDIAPKLPETWEEFCKFYPVIEESYIGRTSDVNSEVYQFRDSNKDKNFLPSKEAAEAHLALMQLHQLRDCYRQGWVPDWNNNSKKYCISFWGEPDGYSISPYAANRHFLSFQSREVAEKFLEHFKDLIDQAGDLI